MAHILHTPLKHACGCHFRCRHKVSSRKYRNSSWCKAFGIVPKLAYTICLSQIHLARCQDQFYYKHFASKKNLGHPATAAPDRVSDEIPLGDPPRVPRVIIQGISWEIRQGISWGDRPGDLPGFIQGDQLGDLSTLSNERVVGVVPRNRAYHNNARHHQSATYERSSATLFRRCASTQGWVASQGLFWFNKELVIGVDGRGRTIHRGGAGEDFRTRQGQEGGERRGGGKPLGYPLEVNGVVAL